MDYYDVSSGVSYMDPAGSKKSFPTHLCFDAYVMPAIMREMRPGTNTMQAESCLLSSILPEGERKIYSYDSRNQEVALTS